MNKYDELIANLSRDVAPVAPSPRVNTLAMTWFLLSAILFIRQTVIHAVLGI